MAANLFSVFVPLQMQQNPQTVQQQPQPAPPARAAKKPVIINPETGTGVLADMERERKQPSGPKTSHAIDIRSPTGETIVSAPAANSAGAGHDEPRHRHSQGSTVEQFASVPVETCERDNSESDSESDEYWLLD
jgi:hypothetical protein